MTAEQLKDYLSEDTSRIETVLEKLGCHDIWYSGLTIRCAKPNSDDNTKVSVHIDTLWIQVYTSGATVTGDIFELVKYIKKVDFKGANRFIHSCLGLQLGGYQKTFSAENPLQIFKDLISLSSHREYNEDSVKKFDRTVFWRFYKGLHHDFFKEGIIPRIAERYELHYDSKDNRVVIPHFHFKDKNVIVGLAGRLMLSKEEIKLYGASKYWNYIRGYKKSWNLYGFSHNIEHINQRKMLIIFEGEKSVMILSSWGLHIGVSVGCHSLSEIQTQIILNHTDVDTEVVVGFDVGVKHSHIIDTCKMLSPFRKTSYIPHEIQGFQVLDDDMAPVDKGVQVFAFLLENRINVE